MRIVSGLEAHRLGKEVLRMFNGLDFGRRECQREPNRRCAATKLNDPPRVHRFEILQYHRERGFTDTPFYV
jgi:hypothetical protein